MRRAILLLLVMGACTRNNPDYCDQDSDCTDASKPFCDVNGEYAESDHTSHTCTMTPANCPVDRCPCAPGKGLSCSGDDLISCAEDGHSTQTSTCTLGCSADQPHCLTFDPVNGLGVAMDLAAMEADVILSAGTKIDTSVGTVLDSGGNMIPLRSVLVAQNGGAMIRAFVAKSFVIDGLTVTGTYPVAIVSPGPITIRGQLDASASGTTPGPGAQDSPATCAAPSVPILTCYPMQLIYCNKGAGGGGGVTSGGAGGGPTTAGGAPGAAFGLDFLAGGCHGGHLDTSGGGGGGGAVQITSATSILLVNMGLIDVGGGGGQSGRGGGSGGTIILEAPTLGKRCVNPTLRSRPRTTTLRRCVIAKSEVS
jgi:hypothetical protein